MLTKRYPIYVYPRNKADIDIPAKAVEIIGDADIKLVKAPLMDISGSFIRQGIKDGKDMSCFLPNAVWKYIEANNYYC